MINDENARAMRQLLFLVIILCYFVSCDDDGGNGEIMTHPLIGEWQGELTEVYQLTPINEAGESIRTTTVNSFVSPDFQLSILPELDYSNGSEVRGSLAQIGLDSLQFNPLPGTCPPDVRCFFHANNRQAFTQVGDSLWLTADEVYIDRNLPDWDVRVEYSSRARLAR